MEQLDYLLGYAGVFLWAFGICQVKATRDKKRWLLSGILCAEVILITYLHPKDERLYWGRLLLIILTFMFFVEEKWKRKVVLFLFSLGFIDVVATPIRTVMVIIEFIRKENLNRSFGTVLETLCILGLICYIKKHDKIAEWLRELPTHYYFVGFLCSFMASGISSYIEMELENKSFNEKILMSVLVMITVELLYIMCIGAAVIATFCKNYKEENLLKDDYLRLSKQHYETLLKNTQEIRSLRHDMQSHVNALSYFSKEKDWDKLQTYIEEVNENAQKVRPYTVNVNHGFINAILEDSLSKEPEIAFSCDGKIPADIQVDDFDLCTIFSNLIRNAVEACNRLPKDAEKWIHLKLYMLQDNLYIRMENPVMSEVNVKKIEGRTSKEDKKNHGFGIYNLKNAVEKYQGEVSFDCENQKFIAEIVLWNV